jgi:hypothetical protein
MDGWRSRGRAADGERHGLRKTQLTKMLKKSDARAFISERRRPRGAQGRCTSAGAATRRCDKLPDAGRLTPRFPRLRATHGARRPPNANGTSAFPATSMGSNAALPARVHAPHARFFGPLWHAE